MYTHVNTVEDYSTLNILILLFTIKRVCVKGSESVLRQERRKDAPFPLWMESKKRRSAIGR